MQYNINSINELPEKASPKDEYWLVNQWPQYVFVYQQFPTNVASKLKQDGRWVIALYDNKPSAHQAFYGYKFFDKESSFPTIYVDDGAEKAIMNNLVTNEGYENFAAKIAATNLINDARRQEIVVDMSTGNTYKTNLGSFDYPYDLKQLTDDSRNDSTSHRGETSLDK